MRAPTNRTQETSPANFHDSVKRKLVNSVKKSKTYGGRFIANRKASRLDLDPKQCGPTGVKFVRGTVQCDRKKESCSPEFEGSARTVGVCQSGAAYRLAAATMLLQLGSDTDELCDQLDASRRDDTPTPHHYASRVLRFQDQASPDSVLQAPSAASSGPAVSRALFSQHRTGLSPVNMATQRFLSNGYAQHRFINEKPYRNLDAPGLADDFYRSPLDWRFVHVFFFLVAMHAVFAYVPWFSLWFVCLMQQPHTTQWRFLHCSGPRRRCLYPVAEHAQSHAHQPSIS